MKKIALILALLVSFSAWAQNTVTLTPDAGLTTFNTTYNGQAVNGVIDLSALSPGDVFCVDVDIAGTNFTLAGFEFALYFPSYLTLQSATEADWANEAGNVAIVKIGSDFSGLAVQKLPALSDGTPTNSQLINNLGENRCGFLFTNVADRPASGFTGTIAHLCFQLNANYGDYGSGYCTAGLEAIRILLTQNASTQADIFANEAAERVAVVSGVPVDVFGRAGLAVYLGASGDAIRADGNGDGVRNGTDALACLRCAYLGQGDSICANAGWNTGGGDADFFATFNANCDTGVNGIDALTLLRYCYGLQNRNNKTAAPPYAVESRQGVFVVDSEGTTGAMASLGFRTSGVNLAQPIIDDTARDAGWSIDSKVEAGTLQYFLFNVNPQGADLTIPTVQIPYEVTGKTGEITLVQTLHQKANLKEFGYSPIIADHPIMESGKEELKQR